MKLREKFVAALVLVLMMCSCAFAGNPAAIVMF